MRARHVCASSSSSSSSSFRHRRHDTLRLHFLAVAVYVMTASSAVSLPRQRTSPPKQKQHLFRDVADSPFAGAGARTLRDPSWSVVPSVSSAASNSQFHSATRGFFIHGRIMKSKKGSPCRVRSALIPSSPAGGNPIFGKEEKRGGRPNPFNKKVNQEIVASRCPEEVMGIVNENFDRLNHINVITAVHRIAKLNREWLKEIKIRDLAIQRLRNKTEMLFEGQYPISIFYKSLEQRQFEWDRLIEKLESQSNLHDGRGITSMLWSFATLQHHPNHETMNNLIHRLHECCSSLSSQGITNSLWSLVKLQYRPDADLMESILDRILDLRKQWSPQCVSNTLWALATLEYNALGSKGFIQNVEDELVEKLKFFKPQELSNTFWAFARLQYKPSDIFLAKVNSRLVACMGFLKPQELSNILWSYAKLDTAPTNSTLNALQDQAVAEIRLFKPQAISNTMWAIAKLQIRPKTKLLHAVEEACAQSMSSFSMQNLQNVLWAYATLNLPHSDLLIKKSQTYVYYNARNLMPADVANQLWSAAVLSWKIEDRVVRVLQHRALESIGLFTSQELANTLWGLGTLSYRPIPLFLAKFEEQLVNVIDTFKVCEVLSVMAGFSRLALTPSNKCFKVLRTFVEARFEEFSPGHITTLSYALSRMHNPDRPSKRVLTFFDAVAARADALIPNFTLHETATLLNSYARLRKPPSDTILGSVALLLRQNPTELHPFEVSNLYWSYAKLELRPASEISQILERATEQMINEFGPQGLSNTLWAMIKLQSQPPPRLFKALQLHALGQIDSFRPQEVANLVWALASGHTNESHPAEKRLLISLHRRATAVDSFTKTEASTVLWGLTRLSVQPKGLLLDSLKRNIEGAQNHRDSSNEL